MRRLLVLVTVATALPACRTVAPARFEDLRAGERLAGSQFAFPGDGGVVYDSREALTEAECESARDSAKLTACGYSRQAGVHRYAGIPGGDLESIELFEWTPTTRVAGVRAVPRWPEGVSGLEAQLRHLGLTTTGAHGYSDAQRALVMRTSVPNLLVGVTFEGESGSVAWVARVLDGWSALDLPLGIQTFEQQQQSARSAVERRDWPRLTRLLEQARLVDTPETRAVLTEIDAAISEHLKELAKRWTSLDRELWAALPALLGAAVFLTALPPDLPAPHAAAAELRGGVESGAEAYARQSNPGSAAARMAVAGHLKVRSRELGAPSARGLLVSELRLLRLVGPLRENETGYHRARDLLDWMRSKAAAEASPINLAVRSIGAELIRDAAAALGERRLAAAHALVLVGLERAEGKFDPAKYRPASEIRVDGTPGQKQLLALLAQVSGAVPGADSRADLWAGGVRNAFSFFHEGIGPLDGATLAALARESGGPQVALRLDDVVAEVKEEIRRKQRSELRTRSVEVANTEGFARHAGEIRETEAFIAWVDEEIARIRRGLPPRIRDDEVLVDRTTGMGIASGKELNRQRRELEGDLERLENARRASVRRLGELSRSAPAATRTEERLETVTHTEEHKVWSGRLIRRMAVTGGGIETPNSNIVPIVDVPRSAYADVAAIIEAHRGRVEAATRADVAKLAKQFVEKRVFAHVAEEAKRHGWSEAELRQERAAWEALTYVRFLFQ